jgi:hypothetical protein
MTRHFTVLGQWYRHDLGGGATVDYQYVGPIAPPPNDQAFLDTQGNRIHIPSPYLRWCEISGPGGTQTSTWGG